MKKAIVLLCLVLANFVCTAREKQKITDRLDIMPLSEHAIVHITYLQTETFGRVACNGLIFVNNNEAVIMDTPPDDSSSEDLLKWFAATYPNAKIKAVIINHFHKDCLGGINAFHRLGISSYGYILTRQLALKDSATPPKYTFEEEWKLNVGGADVISGFYGSAHTYDNIVTAIPSEALLFGGCMIKSVGSGRGNIADADLKEWSKTVKAVRERFPAVRTVVPGHGDVGGPELLDYTIDLFKKKKK